MPKSIKNDDTPKKIESSNVLSENDVLFNICKDIKEFIPSLKGVLGSFGKGTKDDNSFSFAEIFYEIFNAIFKNEITLSPGSIQSAIENKIKSLSGTRVPVKYFSKEIEEMWDKEYAGRQNINPDLVRADVRVTVYKALARDENKGKFVTNVDIAHYCSGFAKRKGLKSIGESKVTQNDRYNCLKRFIIKQVTEKGYFDKNELIENVNKELIEKFGITTVFQKECNLIDNMRLDVFLRNNNVLIDAFKEIYKIKGCEIPDILSKEKYTERQRLKAVNFIFNDILKVGNSAFIPCQGRRDRDIAEKKYVQYDVEKELGKEVCKKLDEYIEKYHLLGQALPVFGITLELIRNGLIKKSINDSLNSFCRSKYQLVDSYFATRIYNKSSKDRKKPFIISKKTIKNIENYIDEYFKNLLSRISYNNTLKSLELASEELRLKKIGLLLKIKMVRDIKNNGYLQSKSKVNLNTVRDSFFHKLIDEKSKENGIEWQSVGEFADEMCMRFVQEIKKRLGIDKDEKIDIYTKDGKLNLEQLKELNERYIPLNGASFTELQLNALQDHRDFITVDNMALSDMQNKAVVADGNDTDSVVTSLDGTNGDECSYQEESGEASGSVYDEELESTHDEYSGSSYDDLYEEEYEELESEGHVTTTLQNKKEEFEKQRKLVAAEMKRNIEYVNAIAAQIAGASEENGCLTKKMLENLSEKAILRIVSTVKRNIKTLAGFENDVVIAEVNSLIDDLKASFDLEDLSSQTISVDKNEVAIMYGLYAFIRKNGELKDRDIASFCWQYGESFKAKGIEYDKVSRLFSEVLTHQKAGAHEEYGEAGLKFSPQKMFETIVKGDLEKFMNRNGKKASELSDKDMVAFCNGVSYFNSNESWDNILFTIFESLDKYIQDERMVNSLSCQNASSGNATALQTNANGQDALQTGGFILQNRQSMLQNNASELQRSVSTLQIDCHEPQKLQSKKDISAPHVNVSGMQRNTFSPDTHVARYLQGRSNSKERMNRE